MPIEGRDRPLTLGWSEGRHSCRDSNDVPPDREGGSAGENLRPQKEPGETRKESYAEVRESLVWTCLIHGGLLLYDSIATVLLLKPKRAEALIQ